MTAATAGGERRFNPAQLGLWAGTGVVIYVAIDVALAFLRPDLSLLHRAESDYGVGPYSCLMDVNFLIRGVLSLLLAAALLRLGGSPRLRWGIGLIAVWGVASGLLAFFPDNPPGTPVTTSGGIHLTLALVAFLAVAVGTIVLAVNFRQLPRLQPLAGPALALALIAVIPLLLLGRTHFQAHTLDGLYERLFLGLELLWILVVGLRLHQTRSPSPEMSA
ncbi:MAG TPA: DUF998 domain-containing protein [Candidatus Dormibacteraeota bacterium]